MNISRDAELLQKTLAANKAAYGSHQFFVVTSKAERMHRIGNQTCAKELQKAGKALMREVAMGRTVRLCAVLLSLVAGLYSSVAGSEKNNNTVPSAPSSTIEKTKLPLESNKKDLKRPKVETNVATPSATTVPVNDKRKKKPSQKSKKMKTALSALGSM